jgi:hypothetical protein
MSSVKNVKITVDLTNTSVTVFAGNTPEQAENGLFQDDGNPTQDLIAEVLLKVLAAMRGTLPTIDLNIPDGKFIKRDLSFPVPASALASAARRSVARKAAATAAPKKTAARKAAATAAPKKTAARKAAATVAPKKTAAKASPPSKPKSSPKKGTARGKQPAKTKESS